MKYIKYIIVFLLIHLTRLQAEYGLVSSWQEPHGFSYEWDTGIDSAVFLIGSANEIGAWNPADAVRLTWTSGNIWTGVVSLPAGEQHEYKFIKRNMAAEQYCSLDNIEWMPGDNLVISNIPIPRAPYNGKTVYYHSCWSNVHMVFRCGNTQWLDYAMQVNGTGRTDDELLYKLENIGTNDHLIEFVFSGMSNGVQVWDNSPYEGPESGDHNYYTMMDVFWVQDKEVFNYQPGSSVSKSRIEERVVYSTVAEIPERTIRIYLPRGYDETTWKSYPVFYMHDGQNLFCDENPVSTKWNVNYHADREISQGRMRECIIVGIDNNGNRLVEYEIPGDRYNNECQEGIGDMYLQFFMQNVKPTLDYNFRAASCANDTLVGGSSMGGLISIYFGYATNVFGGVMAMSPAVTRATNFTASLWNENKRNIRLYVDTGSAEGSVGTPGGDYWYKPWEAYAIFLQQGYTVNDNLLMRIGCGQQHNEAAWSERFPDALRFLLDVRRETNLLAQREHPPKLQGEKGPENDVKVVTSSFFGFKSCLYWRESLLEGNWQTNSLAGAEEKLWGTVVFSNNIQQGQYRVSAICE